MQHKFQTNLRRVTNQKTEEFIPPEAEAYEHEWEVQFDKWYIIIIRCWDFTNVGNSNLSWGRIHNKEILFYQNLTIVLLY